MNSSQNFIEVLFGFSLVLSALGCVLIVISSLVLYFAKFEDYKDKYALKRSIGRVVRATIVLFLFVFWCELNK